VFVNVDRVRRRGLGIAAVFAAILGITAVAMYALDGPLVSSLVSAFFGLSAGMAASYLGWHWRLRHPLNVDSLKKAKPLPAAGSAGILIGQLLGLTLVRSLAIDVKMPIVFWLCSAFTGAVLYVVWFVPDSAWEWVDEEAAVEFGIDPPPSPSSRVFTWLASIGMVLIVLLLLFAAVNALLR
jgi:hypothetical protein